MEQKIQDEGEMQSALMPQELNPEFVSDKEMPLRAIFPLRQRRDIYDSLPTYDTTTNVKSYSRIITCVVLAVSALIEIIVYTIETFCHGYQGCDINLRALRISHVDGKMKWLVLLCALMALLISAVAQDFFDYTGKYAELASPVPSNVDIDDLVATLRAASRHA